AGGGGGGAGGGLAGGGQGADTERPAPRAARNARRDEIRALAPPFQPQSHAGLSVSDQVEHRFGPPAEGRDLLGERRPCAPSRSPARSARGTSLPHGFRQRDLHGALSRTLELSEPR